MTDPRHPSIREADQALWERLFSGHSPLEEVRWSPDMSAEQIAEQAWNDYNDPTVAPDWLDLDRDETLDSLTRTLRYEGGAA